MDRDVLMHQMTERFQALYGKALNALESAPEGRWIADSEWAFRDAFQQLMTESYQAAVERRIDAQPASRDAAFSPSPRRGRRRGRIRFFQTIIALRSST